MGRGLKIWRDLFITNRVFYALGLATTLFLFSNGWDILFPVAQALILVLIVLFFLECILLFGVKRPFSAVRTCADKMSLGDQNKVRLKVRNNTKFKTKLTIIDEIPYQLQIRDFELRCTLDKTEHKVFNYQINPKDRGVYQFGNINVFARAFLGLIQRRHVLNHCADVHVYPSIIQMKKYELMAFSKTSIFEGIKKIRRIGNANEFEQIKNYVQGDDFRHINWKATSRRRQLMVNQYQEERSQQVYTVIDKSRVMRMPFNGLTLLDHAINTSLVITNVVLQKYDKAGLITFSDKLGSRVKAERKGNQLSIIADHLYKQKTNFNESNYNLLYQGIKRFITGRSLLFFYTNFESIYALNRVLPILRQLNRNHVLVVIFFENEELINLANKKAERVKDIYDKTFARKQVMEKKQISAELKKYGIQSILTKPENLSIDTINKYLELKSRGMI